VKIVIHTKLLPTYTKLIAYDKTYMKMPKSFNVTVTVTL